MLAINKYNCNWPDELEPQGEGSFDKEPFDEWWTRHGARLAHLEPRIAEQWVYKHWHHSPYSFLDLDRLAWRLEVWPSDRVMSDVYVPDEELTPEYTYEEFNARGGIHTAKVMNATGTWDYPMLILSTPNGVRDRQPRPDVRFLLIEGHLRYRYLNALMWKGRPTIDHEMFVLDYSA